MRHGMKVVALAALLALSACGKGTPAADTKEAAKEEAPGITLTAEQSQGLGLQTARLAAADYRGQITGYGMVMAFDAIAQSDADIASAEAVAAQSQAAAAQSSQQAPQPLQSPSLGLLFHAAEDRGQQRLCAGRRLGVAHAQIARDGLQAARLGKDVGEVHGVRRVRAPWRSRRRLSPPQWRRRGPARTHTSGWWRSLGGSPP